MAADIFTPWLWTRMRQHRQSGQEDKQGARKQWQCESNELNNGLFHLATVFAAFFAVILFFFRGIMSKIDTYYMKTYCLGFGDLHSGIS